MHDSVPASHFFTWARWKCAPCSSCYKIERPQVAEGAPVMPVEYVHEYCGFAGVDPAEDHVGRAQWRDCGEMVVPLPPGSGLA